MVIEQVIRGNNARQRGRGAANHGVPQGRRGRRGGRGGRDAEHVIQGEPVAMAEDDEEDGFDPGNGENAYRGHRRRGTQRECGDMRNVRPRSVTDEGDQSREDTTSEDESPDSESASSDSSSSSRDLSNDEQVRCEQNYDDPWRGSTDSCAYKYYSFFILCIHGN